MAATAPINGSTTVAGIFGFPVKHSLSPAMHNAAFAALRVNGVYVPFEVEPGELRNAVRGIRALDLAGVNVTIPHKEKVGPFLDRIDPAARRIGSVNTIVNRGGRLTGYNTDAPGFIADLRAHGFTVRGKKALLAGSGGAGRAVAFALAQAGVRELLLTDANGAQARRLSKAVRTSAVKVSFVPLARWKDRCPEVDLLVNATPVGMHPGDAPLVTARHLRRGTLVYDLVYNRRTALETEARKAGARYMSGAGMLLMQGALAFELFTGRQAPVAVMRAALARALRRKHA